MTHIDGRYGYRNQYRPSPPPVAATLQHLPADTATAPAGWATRHTDTCMSRPAKMGDGTAGGRGDEGLRASLAAVRPTTTSLTGPITTTQCRQPRRSEPARTGWAGAGLTRRTYLRRQAEMPEDPPNHARLLDERDEPPATPGTRQHVSASAPKLRVLGRLKGDGSVCKRSTKTV
ncbi:MAG: hypothetical protein GEU99_16705 [Luteitalea sp.]|nr:hypothetical protein [Luteitalea sp.]